MIMSVRFADGRVEEHDIDEGVYIFLIRTYPPADLLHLGDRPRLITGGQRTFRRVRFANPEGVSGPCPRDYFVEVES